MANSLCFTPLTSFNPPSKPGLITGNSTARKVLWLNDITKSSKILKFQSVEAKATNSNQGTKPNSIVCAKCEGNGAVMCSQCKGSGVNSVDHFNGQFKAGGLCWLCSCNCWTNYLFRNPTKSQFITSSAFWSLPTQ